MKTQAHWTAVALAKDIRRKPQRVIFNGKPVVLFQTSKGISALHDRCPHRHVELSGGRVVDDAIECPYHGWRFDGAGACVAVPGSLDSLPKCKVPILAVTEQDGAIFLSDHAAEGQPYSFNKQDGPVLTSLVKSEVTSSLIDAAENILDATHTHFTHKGLLRGLSSQRFIVDVEIRSGDDWVEAIYTGEDRQQGVISKLLEGERLKTVGRFKAPGIAELEYWGPQGMELCTSFHLRETGAQIVSGIGWLVGPKRNLLSHVKALMFRPLFTIALHQDRRVLRSAMRNSVVFDAPKPVIGPLDFLRKDIERIMAGQPVKDGQAAPKHFKIEL